VAGFESREDREGTALVEVSWRPEARDLRRFGAGLVIGFGLLGASLHFGWPLAQCGTAAAAIWIAGGAAGGLALTGTRAALPFYLAWMGFAWVMGNLVSRLVLTLVFILFILPMGLFFRLIGRDRLGLRGKTDSYWADADLPEDIERYDRQF
jgi:hypothetical protein